MKNLPKTLVHGLFALFVSSFIAGLLSPPDTVAQPASQPLEKFVVTDGIVSAMAFNSNVLYLGGSFSQVGLRTGSGVPVSATTGQAEAVYPSVSGDVDAAVSDGQGGWFIGGLFSLVGDSLHSSLAHIKSDRSVDQNWSPSVAGGSVDCLILAGNTLYLGGSFTNVNGQPRNGAAAVDSASGALKSWDPNVNGAIKAMIFYTTNIYLGGEFTSVGSQIRNHLAAVDLTSGTLSGWNPNVNDDVEAMVLSGGHLFVGGYFGSVSSQFRGCGASFDLSTGLLDSWNPNPTGIGLVGPDIMAMAAWQNTIFVGGLFGSIGSSNRINIAALDATTGLATSWDAHQVILTPSGIPVDYVLSLCVYSNALYVGGPLNNIGGQSRGYAAALDLTTGNALVWDPKANAYPLTFCGTGNTIYLGGIFGALGCATRTNMAAFDTGSDQITPWAPAVLPSINGPIYTMVVASNQMFIGGTFTNVNGLARTNLAALDLASGTVMNWAPNPSTTVVSLATWSNRLFVGGTFRSISGAARTNFAEFNLATGALTSWDPTIRSFVQAMVVNSNTLYVGGLFTSASGQTRHRMAAFDLTSDTLTPWDSSITNGSQVDAIAIAGNTIYLGGRFTGFTGGYIRTNFAALDLTTGQVLPLMADTDGLGVYSLAATSN